ncbi:MAG: polysaccharide biosynthesis/export family protein [Muribaculaceae bacterium]
MTKFLFTAFATIMLFASCSTSKENLTYFSNLSDQTTGTIPSGNYELKVIPDDELIITVTSLVPEATAQFNAPMTNVATRSVITPTQQASLITYVVDKDGYITMPTLGKIKVIGLSTKQIADHITTLVSETVSDPYVRVQLINFRVNVLGEVQTPGPMTTTKSRYSILDAIADAGDLTEYGRRDNILLIREENGQRIYHRLNLNDVELLTSPYFYLQQNDVVYVEPNDIKKANSRYNQDNSYKLSVISTIVSAASVLASLAIVLIAK